MAQQIEWTPQALQDFHAIIVYLEENWSVDIADTFIATTESKLAILAEQPFIGIRSEKHTNIRSISLTKHNRLYYRIETNKLVVLNIFDTRQDPSQNLY